MLAHLSRAKNYSSLKFATKVGLPVHNQFKFAIYLFVFKLIEPICLILQKRLYT